jgi:uncharacterized alpha-E superfamily protein
MVMLSRVADSLFWMGRYLERAEQIARQLEVTRDLLVDLTEPDPAGAQAEWQATLSSLSTPNLSIERLVFDATEQSSLAGCIGQARENARQVREVIANEMWEQINRTHWSLIETRDTDQDETATTRILTETVSLVASWDGLTDSSMDRGQAWIFLKLGKWIERLNRIGQAMTARLALLTDNESTTKENIVLVVMLKSLGALEAYRKLSPTRIDKRGTLEFIMFQSSFPRSLRFCAVEAEELVRNLSRNCQNLDASVGRSFGKLASRLDHSDFDEVINEGLEGFIYSVIKDTNRASSLLQRAYFLQ